jgi:hypothetical protein
VPYSDIKKYDVVLPNISLVTKYPSNLPPEEQVSSLQWAKTDQLNVCVMSNLYSETDYDTDRDIQGIHTVRKVSNFLPLKDLCRVRSLRSQFSLCRFAETKV